MAVRRASDSYLQNIHPSRTASHTQLAALFSSLLPPGANDVAFLYHVPRHWGYEPSRTRVTDVVLSITPTTGVYAALASLSPKSDPVCFLHRPWSLDRHRVPKNTLVLASHKTFDELLTVGWNPVLAAKLGFNASDDAICVQGYKGDPDRKIGLIARSACEGERSLEELVSRIRLQFDGAGEFYANGSSSPVHILAIMNAFHPEEVDRVTEAIESRGWATGAEGVLYLTGQVRELGLQAAGAKNLPVMCVGHRACEEWGIRYLASVLRSEHPAALRVQEVFEEEEPAPSRKSYGKFTSASLGQNSVQST